MIQGAMIQSVMIQSGMIQSGMIQSGGCSTMCYIDRDSQESKCRQPVESEYFWLYTTGIILQCYNHHEGDAKDIALSGNIASPFYYPFVCEGTSKPQAAKHCMHNNPEACKQIGGMPQERCTLALTSLTPAALRTSKHVPRVHANHTDRIGSPLVRREPTSSLGQPPEKLSIQGCWGWIYAHTAIEVLQISD